MYAQERSENFTGPVLNDASIPRSWQVFPNTTLHNIDSSGCSSSIDGTCKSVSSLQECISICDSAGRDACRMGYYIEDAPGIPNGLPSASPSGTRNPSGSSSSPTVLRIPSASPQSTVGLPPGIPNGLPSASPSGTRNPSASPPGSSSSPTVLRLPSASPQSTVGLPPGIPNGICVPMLHHTDIGINPYYRFRNQDTNPLLEGKRSYVFTSRSELPFPPDTASSVFYTDRFRLHNIGGRVDVGIPDSTDFQVGAIPVEDPKEGVEKVDKSTALQFLPLEILRDKIQNYIFVRNQDEVVINIPHTAFLMRKDTHSDRVLWLLRESTSVNPSNTFTIHARRKNAKRGDVLSYADQFYFTYLGGILTYNSSTQSLEILSESLENAEANSENIFFRLEPELDVFYCDPEGSCEKVPLSKCKVDQKGATYKDIPVSRSPECWGMCLQKSRPKASGAHSEPSLDEDDEVPLALPLTLTFVVVIAAIAALLLLR